MNEIFDWDGDWCAIHDEAERETLERELSCELCPEHILFGRKVSVLGRRFRRDDFLFRLDDGSVAQVHLTWRAEISPNWPATEIYSSFAEWKSVPLEDR